MSVSGSVLTKSATKRNECNPASVSVPSTRSPVQQLMALQTQVLQANSQMVMYMRQVLSAQAKSPQDIQNDVGSLNPISPTIKAIQMSDLEKLVETQTVLLQQVSQLTTLSQQVLECHRSSHKETGETQLDESQRGAHSQPVVECHCCEFYGVPCRRNSANQDEARTRRDRMLFSGQKRKKSPQEQLLEDSLLPNMLSFDALQYPQKEKGHQNSGDDQLRREALDRYLDEFTITCTVFEPPGHKRFKRKTNEVDGDKKQKSFIDGLNDGLPYQSINHNSLCLPQPVDHTLLTEHLHDRSSAKKKEIMPQQRSSINICPHLSKQPVFQRPPVDQLGCAGQLCQSSNSQVLSQLSSTKPNMEPNTLSTPTPKP